MRYYMWVESLAEPTGEALLKLLEEHLFVVMHPDDRPFERGYFLAIMRHDFGTETVLAYVYKRFMNRRKNHFENLYLMIVNDHLRHETRRSASKYVPGNSGILVEATTREASFYQMFKWPNPREHTYSVCSSGNHRGVCGIIAEYITASNEW